MDDQQQQVSAPIHPPSLKSRISSYSQCLPTVYQKLVEPALAWWSTKLLLSNMSWFLWPASVQLLNMSWKLTINISNKSLELCEALCPLTFTFKNASRE